MIYFELLAGFLKVGVFSFGGAYGAIPLIRDIVLSYGWLEEETLTYMIAVSESTPGPIMVNLATYIGSCQAGFSGALIATMAVVFPSFFIILIVTAFLKTALKNVYVQAALRGMKPCMIGIVLATGGYMSFKNVFGTIHLLKLNIQAIIIFAFIIAIILISKYYRKKKLSPVAIILLSAVAGVFVYGV